MRNLEVDEVLWIHDYVIEHTGGSHGVHNLGLLESAVARPRSTFGGDDLYVGVFSKAAALLESLALNHAFVDGNKRTAITSASEFLLVNDWEIVASNRELVDYTIYVVVDRPGIEAVASWLEDKSRPYHG